MFAITFCGYRVRCALEDDDGANLRLDKLCALIEDSDYTIHDLSRTQLGDGGLPRFNMPFELGLMMGARRFGGPRQKQKRACIMVAEPYALPRYLSDIAGADPNPHQSIPGEIIRIVRDHLHRDPTGAVLPGAQYLGIIFEQFKADLPRLIARARLTVEEANARRSYRNFMDLLTGFRNALPAINKASITPPAASA